MADINHTNTKLFKKQSVKQTDKANCRIAQWSYNSS